MNNIFGTDENLMHKDIFSIFKEFLKKEFFGDPLYNDVFLKIWNALNEIEYRLNNVVTVKSKLDITYQRIDNIDTFDPDYFVEYLYLVDLKKIRVFEYTPSFNSYKKTNKKDINNALNELYYYVFENLIYLILKAYLDHFDKYGIHNKYGFIRGLLYYLERIVDSFKIINNIDNFEITKIKQLFIVLLKPLYKDYLAAMTSPEYVFDEFIKQIYNLTVESTYSETKEELWVPFLSNDQRESFIEVYDLNMNSENYNGKISSLYLSHSLIISALEGIEGVLIEIEEVSKGSLVSKIRMIIKSAIAKKEVKKTFILAAEIAGNQVKTSVSGTLKTIAEVRKAEIENEIALRKSKANLPIKKLRELNEIGLEKERLDKRKIEAEVTILEQEAIQKKIQTVKQLAELVSQGWMSVEDFRIHVNGQLLINKEKERIEFRNINEVFPD